MSNGRFDPEAFRTFEVAGWEEQAEAYHRFFAPITSRVIDPLVAAAEVDERARVLDVASGPGYGAAACAARGATAVGVDVAAAMVELARSRYPAVEFRQADAEQLPFEDESFDAIIGNFAILHLARPEKAVAELVRVLAPRGRLALSTWAGPERCRLAGVFVDAVAQVGAPPPADVPAGPSFFHFADEGAFMDLLAAAGLVDVTVQTHSFTHRLPDADALWDGLLGGTVRSRTIVLGQEPDTRTRIRTAFDALVRRYETTEGLDIPVAVKIASASRPEP